MGGGSAAACLTSSSSDDESSCSASSTAAVAGPWSSLLAVVLMLAPACVVCHVLCVSAGGCKWKKKLAASNGGFIQASPSCSSCFQSNPYTSLSPLRTSHHTPHRVHDTSISS